MWHTWTARPHSQRSLSSEVSHRETTRSQDGESTPSWRDFNNNNNNNDNLKVDAQRAGRHRFKVLCVIRHSAEDGYGPSSLRTNPLSAHHPSWGSTARHLLISGYWQTMICHNFSASARRHFFAAHTVICDRRGCVLNSLFFHSLKVVFWPRIGCQTSNYKLLWTITSIY